MTKAARSRAAKKAWETRRNEEIVDIIQAAIRQSKLSIAAHKAWATRRALQK